MGGFFSSAFDLKHGLEMELGDLDSQIKQARRKSAAGILNSSRLTQGKSLVTASLLLRRVASEFEHWR